MDEFERISDEFEQRMAQLKLDLDISIESFAYENAFASLGLSPAEWYQ